MVIAWNKYQTSTLSPVYLELPPISVNVRQGAQTLNLKICVQLRDKKSLKKFAAHMPEVQSAFVLFVTTLDTKDFEDSNFLLSLKQQLRKRAEDVTEIKIKDLLITEVLLRNV